MNGVGYPKFHYTSEGPSEWGFFLPSKLVIREEELKKKYTLFFFGGFSSSLPIFYRPAFGDPPTSAPPLWGLGPHNGVGLRP